MRMKNMRMHPYSAFDHYEVNEHFTGWQPTETRDGEDIFKQLKINLRKYERKYNESKEKDDKNCSSQPNSAKRTIQDKENLIKLPSIYSVPLKHNFTNKEPFAIKNRNILEDALNYSQENKGRCHKVLRLIKIRKVRNFQICKPLDPDFRLNFEKNAIPARKQEIINPQRKSRRNLQTNRASGRLIDYDFSDSRLHIQSNKPRVKRPQMEENKQNQ